VGSPLYMAPESLRRNEYSFQSDIWALGVIYYEMVFGAAAVESQELKIAVEEDRVGEYWRADYRADQPAVEGVYGEVPNHREIGEDGT
jgi:serine/threonine protein kinase